MPGRQTTRHAGTNEGSRIQDQSNKRVEERLLHAWIFPIIQSTGSYKCCIILCFLNQPGFLLVNVFMYLDFL